MLALGDITCRAEYSNQHPIVAEHRGFDRFDQLNVSVIRKRNFLFVHAGAIGRHRSAVFLTKKIRQFAVHKIVVGPADDLGFLYAKKLFETGIAEQKHAIDVLQPDEIRH